jgi:hypothetical protein
MWAEIGGGEERRGEKRGRDGELLRHNFGFACPP